MKKVSKVKPKPKPQSKHRSNKVKVATVRPDRIKQAPAEVFEVQPGIYEAAEVQPEITAPEPVQTITATMPVSEPLEQVLPVYQTNPQLKPAAEPHAPAAIDANAMFDDIMQPTDKDQQREENEEQEEDEYFEDEEQEQSEDPSPTEQAGTSPAELQIKSQRPAKKTLIDSLAEDSGGEWQSSPREMRRLAAAEAKLWVYGGSKILTAGAQLGANNWTTEGEQKYSFDQETKEGIIDPLTEVFYQKKLKLAKQGKKSSPMGALATAVGGAMFPLIKDRHMKKQLDQKDAEMNELKAIIQRQDETMKRLTDMVENGGVIKKNEEQPQQTQRQNVYAKQLTVVKNNVSPLAHKSGKPRSKFGVHPKGCTCGRPACAAKLAKTA